MSDGEETHFVFNEEDHQAAYVFDPDDEAPNHRPSKRRRVSKKGSSASKDEGPAIESLFVPLMDGKESDDCVRLRGRLFEECWSRVEARIKRRLRQANRVTLDEVESFARDAPSTCGDKIPSAFIVTGPNLASQDLLFEQLEERLAGSTPNRFVKLRSSDAPNLKATLKKIIRDLTSGTSDDNEEVRVTAGKSGRRFLDYDLAAVREYISAQKGCERITVAIQDSEAFDSTLLASLINVLSTWPEIPFTLLFGVATSVELLQNRLSKSTCEHLYGAEFDVAQGATGLEQVIIKAAVAAYDIPLRIGPSLLESLMSRQRDQVAGIQALISSLKYAYMCHFYANPLSVFMPVRTVDDMPWIQPEHLEGIRSMPSFQQHVENKLGDGYHVYARQLLESDEHVLRLIETAMEDRNRWISNLLRCVQILVALGVSKSDFTDTFIEVMTEGVDLNTGNSGIVHAVRKLDPEQIISTMERVQATLTTNDGVRIPSSDDDRICSQLAELITSAQRAVAAAEEEGHTLRSHYSGQTKVIRTTVIAQRVQLSRDSATLTDADKDFTHVVDSFVALLQKECFCVPAANVPLHEIWSYNSRTPYRDAFVPRPRAVFERSLTRPRDYLACDCCDDGGNASALAPPTAILYKLYQEAGALVNVADLWTAFSGIVGGEEGDGEVDERGALALFYQGLAELRALGFVKGSKKKTDHVAKVKWL